MSRPKLTPEIWFGQYYTGARELAEAEKRGTSTAHLDFCVVAMCWYCQKMIEHKPKRCGKCKAVLYCGLDVSLGGLVLVWGLLSDGYSFSFVRM